ncbi:caspase-8-like [Ornithodoros turicata]|uniref:caspase-8-like n=1 Tax=Ornithodoros turicata TaxID=34597 RepID=UPI00313A1F88
MATGLQSDALPVTSVTADRGASCREDPRGEVYRTTGKMQGFCLIIVMEKFNWVLGFKTAHQESRERKFKDKADCIKKTFTKIGFQCEVLKNQDYDKIIHTLKTYQAKPELADSNCFVCWLLTGRTEDKNGKHLYALNKIITLKDITRPFLGDACPALCGKPKLFFVDTDFLAAHEDKTLADNRGTNRDPYRIPESADVLLGMYLAPATNGSDTKYAETVCQLMDSCWTREDDITFLLDKVCEKIASEGWSVPVYISTLRKLLFVRGRPPVP